MGEASMNDNQISNLLGQCKSIRNNALDVLDKYERYFSAYLDEMSFRENSPIHIFSTDTERTLKAKLDHMTHEVDALIDSYKNVYYQVGNLGIKANIVGGKLSIESACRKIIIECDSIIATLEDKVSPLSLKDKSIVDDLKKEIEELCTRLEPDFERNMNKAMDNLVKGDYLGSSLITGRTVFYILSQLGSSNDLLGDSIKEKLKHLIDNKIIKEDIEDINITVMKASKKARNILTHNISIIPDASFSISLLGDCVYIMRIYDIINQYKNQ